MKFVVLSAFSLLVSTVSAFHIGLPGSITTCDPFSISYDTRTGVAPFTLSFHSDSAGGSVLAAFTGVTGTSYTWDQVAIPAGTNVVITLSDSGGKGSSTPVITVGQGSSDTCVNNPTSIPVIPSITTTYGPSSFSGGSVPTISSSSTSSTSLPSGVSSSLSSLSSVISSANSLASGLTSTTSTSQPATTSGLGTNDGVVNAASVFTIGAISAVFGALLA